MISHISFKQRLRLNLFRLFRKAQHSLHELDYLFWECTLKCSLACIHCGSDCSLNPSVRDMPAADFLNVLDSLHGKINPNRIMIVLTGGEPLLRSDLEQCGKEFLRRGFPWGMVTNGWALTEDMFRRLLLSGLRSITVSLDGVEQSHDWMRGRIGSFEKAYNAIKIISQYNGILFDVVTCMNRKNREDLTAVRELLIRAGVKRWRIFTVFPKGRASDNDVLDVSSEEFLYLMEFIKETNSSGKIRADYSCEGFLGQYEGVARSNLFFCRAGITVASVLADGSISACPSLRGDYIQGNIYQDDFYTVWNERYGKMRNRSWMKTGECSSCRQYKFCSGNGLHLRDEKTGKLLRCHYNLINDALKHRPISGKIE